MLLFKRLLTSFILLLILWVALCIGTLAVVGVVVGVRDATNNPNARDFQSGYASGAAAGEKLGERYAGIVLLSTLSVSAAASLTISFRGILPWCRKKSPPPPLPQV
jgi:hypothetical protein